MDEETIKEVARRIRLHADNIFIDYYGDKHAERMRTSFRDLANTIEDPTIHDDPTSDVCEDCEELVEECVC